MAGTRFLIVNADDFGQGRGVNRGIIEAHEHGIVTSASLMVRRPAAAEAAAYARRRPELSVGLHLDLGEWAFRQGAWEALYEVVPVDDAAAVAAEAARQLELFHRLVGRAPTHLDSHQHVHRDEPVRSVLAEIAGRLRIPLRHFCGTIHHCGGFYGQDGKGSSFPDAISPAALIRLFADLPAGVSELGCHPGFDEELDSVYCAERADEVRTLCDPSVRAALEAEGIRLWSFQQWRDEATR
jgi:chitin disaccharide deacetylase